MEKNENQKRSRFARPFTRKFKYSLIGLVAILAVSVYAFTTFTQTFPPVPTGTSNANLSANCTTALVSTPTVVVAGSAFAIVYSCPSGASDHSD